MTDILHKMECAKEAHKKEWTEEAPLEKQHDSYWGKKIRRVNEMADVSFEYLING